ncbi:metal ABC transporter substrate-binding protein [Thermus thermophilus]|uniref:metal ABC transporter substrate-binding protein n=1 Tax=Thermus thermophilus TaxID=274 RepID=UPI001FCD5084|nr:metal ABC transporter substrate-binding protein [Thermus thermophilus]BDG22610.1 ABC transporter substrate-binding protein [Thermus thermophilus]
MRRTVPALLMALGLALAQKPAVVATIHPHGLFLRSLVGDRVGVSVLVPPSANPHVFDPSPSQVQAVAGARLVVANGARLDDWILEKVVRPNSLKTPVVVLAEALGSGLIKTPTGPDPHFWLDPLLMAKALPPLVEALSQADPAGGAVYRARAARLEAELARLDREVAGLLQGRKGPGVITFRNPLRYFTSRYGVKVLYNIVPNPDSPDISARAVAEAQRVAREAGVRHLLIPLAAKEQGVAVARNLGLEPVLVDVLGEGAGDYPTLLRKVAEAFARSLP